MPNVSAILDALKNPAVLAQVTAAGNAGIDGLIGEVDADFRARLIRDSLKRIEFEAAGDVVFANIAASDVALDLRTILNYSATQARETAGHVASILLTAIGTVLPPLWSAVLPLLKGILL